MKPGGGVRAAAMQAPPPSASPPSPGLGSGGDRQAAMQVPAAFRTAPCFSPRARNDDVCMCGSALNAAYVVVTGGDGKSRHTKTPVVWCQRCRLPAYLGPVSGQTEVRNRQFKWACEHCGGRMRRLLVSHRGGGEAAIPLSYCVQCASVSFRPTASSSSNDDVRTCDMCGTDVPSRNRWCAKCVVIADRWRKKHGMIPPSGDPMFGAVVARAREEARRLGWDRADGRRACDMCGTDVSTRNRWCAKCVVIADRWRKKHGSIPSSGDKAFPAVIAQAREEARRLGWDRGENMRACRTCSTAYAPAGQYQRYCDGCAAARERRRLEKKIRGRWGPRRQKMRPVVDTPMVGGRPAKGAADGQGSARGAVSDIADAAATAAAAKAKAKQAGGGRT